MRRQNLVRSQRPPPGRSSPATGTDGRPYQRPRLSPQKESARLRDLHTETSCHSDNCSPYSISDFREIDCIAIGLGMKSRLPIDYPSAWQVSGVGSAFFIPNPANYPLSIVSESAVARAGLRIAPADSSIITMRIVLGLASCRATFQVGLPGLPIVQGPPFGDALVIMLWNPHVD